MITRLCDFLARFFSEIMHQKPIEQKPTFRVLLDGEHIADLNWLYDDQPFHVYRLTPLTEDCSKVDFALQGTVSQGDRLQVVLHCTDTGGLMPESFFISNISWEDRKVYTREFGLFQPPPRQALPDDQIAGFESWAEALGLLRDAVEEHDRYYKQLESEKAVAAQRSLPRPTMPASQELGSLPTPSIGDDLVEKILPPRADGDEGIRCG